jgi:hypothetical protein
MDPAQILFNNFKDGKFIPQTSVRHNNELPKTLSSAVGRTTPASAVKVKITAHQSSLAHTLRERPAVNVISGLSKERPRVYGTL